MKKRVLVPKTREDMARLVGLFLRKHGRVQKAQEALNSRVAILYQIACEKAEDDLGLLEEIADTIEAGIDNFPELASGEERSLVLKSGTIQLRAVTALEVDDEEKLLQELQALLRNPRVPESIKRNVRSCIAIKKSVRKKELVGSPEILKKLTSARKNEYDSITVQPPGAREKISTTIERLKVKVPD